MTQPPAYCYSLSEHKILVTQRYASFKKYVASSLTRAKS
jgi:hypothetical protein